jgi:hypothetical protein
MTETTVERGTDIESIEHLDFEHEEPCDFGRMYGSGCPRASVWRITVSCCGGIILFCQEHMDLILDAIAAGRDLWCNLCETNHNPGSKAILSAEKLDKRSKV